MVSTYEKYSNAILNVTGGNLKSVKEIDNLINEDMIETTLGTFNARMDLITETHEKDVALIMDTLNNITTKLNMQGAYLSFINRFAGALWSHNFFSPKFMLEIRVEMSRFKYYRLFLRSWSR